MGGRERWKKICDQQCTARIDAGTFVVLIYINDLDVNARGTINKYTNEIKIGVIVGRYESCLLLQ